MLINNLIIVIFVILPSLTYGQFTYVSEQSFEVQDQDGNVLALPWTGGLNAAQFNTMDLNGDNVEDLVLFDRMADQVLTFLRSNNTYEYAPEYESVFPNAVRSGNIVHNHFTGRTG